MSVGDDIPGFGDFRAHPSLDSRASSYAVEMPLLKISQSLSIVLDALRERLGASIEILTSTLQPVVPAGGGDLHRVIEMSARIRASVSGVVETGRAAGIDVGDMTFLVQALRCSRGTRPPIGVIAIQSAGVNRIAAAAVPESLSRVLDLVKAAVESDLTNAEALRGERLEARRTYAALRFLSQLRTVDSEAELARAVVHAAAVWFDVDARVYRRDLSGALVLHTHLPGVADTAVPLTLESHLLRAQTVLLTAGEAPSTLNWAVPQALVIPILIRGRIDWALALGGRLPSEAQVVFETVAQTMAAHLLRLDLAHRTAVRTRFEEILVARDCSRELAVMDVLRDLLSRTSAAGAAVTLFTGRGSRHVAAVGPVPALESAPEGPVLEPVGFQYPLTLAHGGRVVLQLLPQAGEVLSSDAAVVAEEAAAAMHLFLSGAAPEAVIGGAPAAFVGRIAEELERAKRFDLGLSMLLIDVKAEPAPADVVEQLMAGIRSELRTSDLLGPVGHGRIAVLLVHTDASAVTAVSSRVRRRLEVLLRAVQVAACHLGRAALSSDCRTAPELLSQAGRDFEPIVAN